MKKLLILLVALCSVFQMQATHLMGGEITWECIKVGPDAGKYIFKLKLYRDCASYCGCSERFLILHHAFDKILSYVKIGQANLIAKATASDVLASILASSPVKELIQ